MQVALKIWRYDRGAASGRCRSYEVEAPEWATLLDVLDIVKDRVRRHARLPQELPDDDLRLVRDADGRQRRCSPARRGWKPSSRRGHVPVISPMGNMPVVKDLVVDMEPVLVEDPAP